MRIASESHQSDCLDLMKLFGSGANVTFNVGHHHDEGDVDVHALVVDD